MPSSLPQNSDTPNVHPDWTTGNVEVITSDNVRFLVHDYILSAVSPMFAKDRPSPSTTPSSTGPPQTYQFTLSNTHSNVFRLFLVVASTLKVPSGPSGPEAPDKLLLGPLLIFLREWKCTTLYDLVVDKVLAQINANEIFPLQAFNIGALTNEIQLCKAALRDHWPSSWTAIDPWWDDGAVRAAHYPWSTRGWSLRLYREHTIPPDFLFALAKARNITRNISSGTLAERFEKCLHKAYQTAPPKSPFSPKSLTPSKHPLQRHAAPVSVTITDDPQWTDGNLHVVTADDVRFKIHDYIMFAASRVFAVARETHIIGVASHPPDDLTSPSEMLTGEFCLPYSSTIAPVASSPSPPSDRPTVLSFDDPAFETAQIFRLFLQFATTLISPLKDPKAPNNIHISQLLRFLDKWECSALRHVLIQSVRSAIKDKELYPLKAFYIGAVANEPQICDEVFNQVWAHDNGDTWWDKETSAMYPWAPSGWSMEFWRLSDAVPCAYLAALVKASEYAAPDDSTCIAEEYKHYFQNLNTKTD